MKKVILLGLIILGFWGLKSQNIIEAQNSAKGIISIEFKPAAYHDTSPPLWQMIQNAEHNVENVSEKKEHHEVFNILKYKGVGLPEGEQANTPDPLSKIQQNYYKTHANKAVNLTVLANFDGLDNQDGVAPPDVQGDVNTQFYMQCVNNHTIIYNRDGSIAQGPFPTSDFWQGTGYDDRNDGDAVILWDEAAQRWVVTQFYLPSSGTQYLLIAISQSSDPTGSYYRYAFGYQYMPDYPKWAVWPDGYYVGANAFDQNNNYAYQGVYVSAFERDKMLVGASAQSVTVQLSTDYWSVFPVDADVFPSTNIPAYYISDQLDSYTGNNQVYLYRLSVDWSAPSANFTNEATLSVASYDLFNSDTEVPQPGTTDKLDLLHYRTMYRSYYRPFPSKGYSSIVMTRTVNDGGVAAVRWYEFRDYGSGWSVYQQGTYNPGDGNWRWMPSIAMNECGDIALGYSVSSGSKYPSIDIVARYADDPTGVMTTNELEILTGNASQTGVSRWGDYTMMSIDPVDNSSFWYTGEYTSGGWNWKTRIANFKLPCVLPTTQASSVSASSITTSSLTLQWTRGDGDSVIVLAKEGAAVDADPQANTSYQANSTFGAGDQIGTGNYVVYVGTGTSVNITGLNACTDYYFAVYEYNHHCKDVCYLTPAATANATTQCSPPSITSVTPDNFFADKGKTLTIDGSNLSGATVTLGGITGTITSNTDNQIVVDFPPGYYTNNTLTVSTGAGSDTYTVTVNKRNIIPVGGGTDPHSTIQSALDGLYAWYGNTAFNSGQLPGRKIIEIYSGTYTEQVAPNNKLNPTSTENLVIRAANGANVDIDATGKDFGIYINGISYVKIKGLTVHGSNKECIYIKGNTNARGGTDTVVYTKAYGSVNGSGIVVDTADNSLLQNNLIYDNYNFGIRVIGSNNVKIINNTIVDNGHESKAPPLPGVYDPAQVYVESGTGTTLKNNILYSQSGNYVFTLKTETGVTVNSSYNTYYKNNNTYLVYYNGNLYSDLASWPDAGTGDIETDPQFVDYANDDFHIFSEAGSYHGGEWPPLTANSGTWTNDASTSPALDAGDPADPYANEPQSGNRINQGAYGNTVQASKTPITNPPQITDASPNYLYEDRGKRITITGSYLQNSTFVLGGVAGTVVSNDGSTAVVDFPPADYVGNDLVVTNAAGSTTYTGISVLQRNIIPVVAGAGITSDNHPTIQSALDGLYAWYGTNSFDAGDLPGRKIIEIYSATYSERVVPNPNFVITQTANLVIRAAAGENVIVDATGKTQGIYVDSLPYVAIYGLTVQNADGEDIYIKGYADTLKYNKLINSSTASGLILENASASVIQNNLIYNNYNFGIRLIGSDNVKVVNNTVADNGHESKAPPLPNSYDPAQIYVQSGTGVQLINNIIFAKAGNYVFTLKTEDGITVNTSYNTYYKNGNTYLVYYNGSVYSDLASWPDAGTGDIDLNPRFVDESNNDYHILSEYGSYHGGEWPPLTTNSGTWTNDASTSPALDAGDPSYPYDNEPVSGSRINQGAYGNTVQASKSPGEYVWDGSESTDWQTPQNWTPEKVPTASDIARIPDGCPNYPKIDENNDECKNLIVEAGASVTTATGGVLTVYNDLTVQGQSAKPGVITINGGDLKVNGNASFGQFSQLNIYTLNLTLNTVNFDKDSRTHYYNTLTMYNYNYGDLFIDGTGTKTVSGTVSTPTSCDSLTIEANAVLEIPSTGALTVKGLLINNGDETNFIIRSDANGTGSLLSNNGVPATCERFITGNNWHLIFAPLSNITTSQLVQEGSDINYNLYSYDETTQDYWDASVIYGTSGWTPEYSSSTLRTDKGLLFNRYGYPDKTYTFTGGSLFAGDKTFTLRYTDVGSGPVNQNGVTSSWDDFEGWNLLGNPYPSAIDWDNVNINKSNIEDVIYYYDDNTDQYKYYGSGTSYNQGITVNGGSRYIPANQGFFVKALSTADGASFVIPNSARVHSDQSFWKAYKDPQNIIRLQVEQADYFDETVIRVIDTLTRSVSLGHDPNLDALKLFAWDKTKPQLYSHDFENLHKEALNTIEKFDNETIVPLGVYIGQEGTYSLHLTKNTFDALHVWLEDTYTHKNIPLDVNQKYVFTSQVGDFTDRFYLHLVRNRPPQVMFSIANQETYTNQLWQFTLPKDLFSDADFGDVLTISAYLNDGKPLPHWLNFDGHTFTGIPTKPAEYHIFLKATDKFGASASTDFYLTVNDNPTGVVSHSRMIVYPNPADNKIYVYAPTKEGQLILYSQTGETITVKNFAKPFVSLDLSHLPGGVYYLKLIKNDGIETVKFIKR